MSIRVPGGALSMRPLISIASCAAYLLHMWAGCCLHHAHTAEGKVGLQQTTIAAVSQGEWINAHTLLGGSSPVSPCPGERCSESQCVSVVAGKVALSKVTTDAHLAVCIGQETQHFSALQSWELDTGELIALPVRLHLYNQVLLI
jgi:hypothetical protein